MEKSKYCEICKNEECTKGDGVADMGDKKPSCYKSVTRLSKDERYLKQAEAVLEGSTCLRRKYGAVIVNNDEMISTGYNGSPRGEENCCDLGYCEREALNIPKGERYELCKSVHAEQNAVISAARRDMIGGTLYIVGKEVSDGSYAHPAPCTICRRMLINAGIERVVGRDKEGNIIEINIHNYR